MPQDNNVSVDIVQPDERTSKPVNYILPMEVYEAIRTAAFERRTSQTQIVVLAVRQYLNIPDAA